MKGGRERDAEAQAEISIAAPEPLKAFQILLKLKYNSQWIVGEMYFDGDPLNTCISVLVYWLEHFKKSNTVY